MVKISTKPFTYGLNFAARPIGNLFKEGLNLGNPIGAIAFGALEIFRHKASGIKENKYFRLMQAGGFAAYGILTINNLVSIAKGDFESLKELPFNASMAYELGKNSFPDYQGKSFAGDLKEVSEDLYLKEVAKWTGQTIGKGWGKLVAKLS